MDEFAERKGRNMRGRSEKQLLKAEEYALEQARRQKIRQTDAAASNIATTET